MARVEVAGSALADLDNLVRVLSLPEDTRERVRRCLQPLETFPRLGPELAGRWEGLRFILGPWRWLLIVYVFIESEDRVVVVSMYDSRSASAPRPRGAAGSE
jgi:hypothetical protein